MVPSADDRLAMARAENDRLRQLQQDLSSFHQQELDAMLKQKVELESKLTEAKSRADHFETSHRKMEDELREALARREQQADTVKDVKRQVDSRMSKLMEELMRKDEMIHQLEYNLRQREKDRERVQLLENMLSHREENVTQLSDEVHKLQRQLNEVEAKRLELQVRATSATERADRLSSVPPSPEKKRTAAEESISSILPLYRHWVADTEREMLVLETVVDNLDEELADIRFVLDNGSSGIKVSSHDRQRLQQARKMERERLAKQQEQLMAAAAANTDAVALNAQAIRSGCENYKHIFEKVSATSVSMLESLRAVRSQVDRHCPSGLASKPYIPSTPAPWPSPSGETETAKVNSVPDPITTQLTESLKTVQEALAAKDEELLQSRGELLASQQNAKMAEMEQQRLAHEVSRQEKEIERLQEDQSKLHSKVAALNDESQRKIDALNERLHETSLSANDKLRTQQAVSDERLASERSTYESSILDLRHKLDETARNLNEEMNTVEKMRGLLEESKQKRLTLKRQKDELQEETQHLKVAMSNQHKELLHAREVAEALEVELNHAKSALSFEAQSRDHQYLGVNDDDIFREWKQSHRQPAAQQRHERPAAAVFTTQSRPRAASGSRRR